MSRTLIAALALSYAVASAHAQNFSAQDLARRVVRVGRLATDNSCLARFIPATPPPSGSVALGFARSPIERNGVARRSGDRSYKFFSKEL